MRKLVVVWVLAVLAGGCGSDQPWQTKDISELMPELKFELTSENGDTVTEEKYLGSINLLFFGYTHCPDVCPITLGRLRGVMNKLPPDVSDDVQVLFVSVDPKRDGPEELREYTDSFGENFIGLTGARDQLDALTKRYRTTYGYGEPDEEGRYEVSHGSAVYAFDAEGNPRLLIRQDDGMDSIVQDITRLVHG